MGWESRLPQAVCGETIVADGHRQRLSCMFPTPTCARNNSGPPVPANKPTPAPQTSAFPALSGLTGRERAEIDAILKPFSAPSNPVLFRQDAAADRMYLISSGRVELSTQLADGSELLHRTIEGGEALGESALGESPGYMATARAVTNVDGFALQVGRFNELRRASTLRPPSRCCCGSAWASAKRSGS